MRVRLSPVRRVSATHREIHVFGIREQNFRHLTEYRQESGTERDNVIYIQLFLHYPYVRNYHWKHKLVSLQVVAAHVGSSSTHQDVVVVQGFRNGSVAILVLGIPESGEGNHSTGA